VHPGLITWRLRHPKQALDGIDHHSGTPQNTTTATAPAPAISPPPYSPVIQEAVNHRPPARMRRLRHTGTERASRLDLPGVSGLVRNKRGVPPGRHPVSTRRTDTGDPPNPSNQRQSHVDHGKSVA
jgi:hypothetical protein